MGAWSLGRRTGRKRRGAIAAVQAQFECRWSIVGGGGQREPAKRDKKTLDGNGVGDDDSDEGSPKPRGPSVKSAHSHACGRERITGSSELKGRFPGHFGRIRMNAERRHSATSLLS
jgi:hypothetical protein